MTNTFKLTKAEFVKIFKRPSIFIMAILLVVTILASITMFSPTERVDNTIVYENVSTSQDYYTNFYDDTSIISKFTIDDEFLATDNILAYYQAINSNTNLLTDYHNNVITTMNKMINETNPTVRETYRIQLVSDLNKFKSSYLSLDSISEFSDIITTPLTDVQYEKKADLINYYTKDACVSLTQLITYATSDQYTASDLVNIYQKNNYEQSLNKVLNNGINFIYTTLKGLAYNFNEFYNDYSASISQALSDLSTIKASRANMLSVLKSYQSYYKLLIESDFPILLINDTTHDNLILKLDEAISYLDVGVADNENLNKHKSIKENIDKCNINYLLKELTSDETSNYNSDIIQVSISDKVIGELVSIQSKVNTNKDILLENIDTRRSDESISNISKEATNYQLLSTTYNNIVIQKVLSHITQDYGQSTYTAFHGYNFENFNKYESTESITLNSYYIDNNTYENSYLNNFTYNQNSGMKTNMYDFVYFSMELCTLIIIIFAMMLVCNLITAETESGTIKLLLVRPYKRSKIITAKVLATIFFVVTFMLFSSLITFIGGYFLYGSATLPVLAVFNSTTAFEISPMLLMIINIITLTLDIIFFVGLALMIAIICKNFAASISCSLVILIINFAFNILFGGTFWYTLLPGMNLHLFKYFGSSFIPVVNANPLASLVSSLLITGIDTSMSIWFSVIISGIYFIAFLAVSYSIFQKRDF